MTVFTDFTPTSQQIFQFQPTLDGAIYTVRTPWSLFGRRFYFEVYDLSGARLLTKPLIGSPNGYDINLLFGYFTSVMVFRAPSQQFEVT